MTHEEAKKTGKECDCKGCRLIRHIEAAATARTDEEVEEKTKELLAYYASLEEVSDQARNFLDMSVRNFNLSRDSFILAYITASIGEKEMADQCIEQLGMFQLGLRENLGKIGTDAQRAQTLRWLREAEKDGGS